MTQISDGATEKSIEARNAQGRLPYWRVLLFDLKLLPLNIPILVSIAFYRIIQKVSPKRIAYYKHKIPMMIVRWILKVNGVSADILGMANLRSGSGPRVIFCNHNSRFDAYILLANLPFHYKSFWSNEAHITTENLFIFEWFGHVFDLFFVHDKKNVRNTVKEFRRAENYLKSGGVLTFFPEGTFTQSQSQPIDPFGEACVRLAVKVEADIIPIVMLNTKYLFERKTSTNANVKVQIGNPIPMRGKNKSDVPEMTELVHRHMIDMYNSMEQK